MATHVKFAMSPRCSIWSLGGFVIKGGPKDINIRQHQQPLMLTTTTRTTPPCIY